MNIGENVVLTGFAEHFSTDMDVLLVLKEIDVLFTVLAPEVIAADVLALMVAKTEFTPEQTTTVIAEFPRPGNTLIITKVALQTDALTVMLLPLSASFITVFTVVPASEESGHSSDEVIMTILE